MNLILVRAKRTGSQRHYVDTEQQPEGSLPTMVALCERESASFEQYTGHSDDGREYCPKCKAVKERDYMEATHGPRGNDAA